MNTVRLTSVQLQETARRLRNPAVRIALRADLPNIVPVADRPLLPVIVSELEKCGETLASVGTLNLICPQKDPDLFPGHENPAVLAFRTAAKKLRSEIRACNLGTQSPRVIRQDAICERVHLNRSSKIALMHSLTQRQIFTVHAARVKTTPSGFLSKEKRRKPHFCILFDWHTVSGTTLANLSSYVTYNRGHVLAVASLFHSGNLQVDEARIVSQANCNARVQHKSLKAAIGFLLATSAHRYREYADMTAARAFDICEAALNRRGQSLNALTHSEAFSLIDGLRLGMLSFEDLSGRNFPPVYAPRSHPGVAA